MGAWGCRPFDNDTALDWVQMLLEAEDDGPLIEALGDALDPPATEYLDADLGSPALAAAETVSALAGAHGPFLPEELADWIDYQTTTVRAVIVDKLRESAIAAVHRVGGKQSELAELWAESDDVEAWRATLADVVRRLSLPGS